VKKLSLEKILISLSIVVITIFHYLTPAPNPLLHGIYRRLYYLPIILAAIHYGLKGGLTASVVISIIYLPHVFEKWGDIPLQTFEALFEILIYNLVGFVTGYLVKQQRKEQDEKEELMVRYKELEKRGAVGEIASIITHEIKTPLASISGALEIVENEIKIPPHKKKLFEILNKELSRINSLINNTLTLFKTERVNKEKVHLSVYINELKTIYSLLPYTEKIRLKLNAQTGLEYLYIDPDMFKQVFINLFNNGIQSIRGDGNIIIGIKKNRNSYLISVKDTGAGIEKKNLKNIFNPFYSTKKSGLGLGLAVVKRIVEMHNGKIQCRSRVRKGTEFIIKLPIQEVP